MNLDLYIPINFFCLFYNVHTDQIWLVGLYDKGEVENHQTPNSKWRFLKFRKCLNYLTNCMSAWTLYTVKISNYMLIQTEKNVAEILKFVNVIILFISIFFVVIIFNFMPYFKHLSCETNKDCPKVHGHNIRCRSDQCVRIWISDEWVLALTKELYNISYVRKNFFFLFFSLVK